MEYLDGADLPSEEELIDILEQVDQCMKESKLGKGADLLEDNRVLFEANKDSETYVMYLLKTASLFVMRARWNEAWDYYDLALGIVGEHIGDKGKWTLFAKEVYLGMGKMSYRLGDYARAEDFLVRSIESPVEEPEMTGAAHIELGNVNGEKGDTDSAIAQYLKAIKILEPINAEKELTRAYNNIADTYYKVGEFEASIEFADKCIALADKTGNTRQVGFGYLTGGEALLKAGDIDRSREYFQKAQEVLEDTDDAYVNGCLFTLLGMIETQVDSYKEAREAFERAKDYLEETDIRYYLARLFHEMGTLEENAGNYNDAEGHYNNALEILSEDECLAECKEVQEHLEKLKKRNA